MSARARPDAGGISLGPLVIAGVLASPALWRALEEHQLALYVALERLLVIVVICSVVGDVVRRYLDVVPVPEPAAETAVAAAVAAPPGGSAAPAAPTPTPFEQTTDWGAGDLDNDDLFLDPLPGEDPHPAIG